MKLIVSGIFVHLIFMGAIFDVYFKTPIISGLQPMNNEISPPAKRLVLFVADGLRAETLFGKNVSHIEDSLKYTPYLRNKIVNLQASWGISHTRVPTESRPGHVALTAGIYEDPSAIAKGWKENPVEFDSVFNESFHTWAWGSPDIIPMFKKSRNVEGYSYSPEVEEFSGKIATHLLDEWVFDKLMKFFQSEIGNEDLKLLHSGKIIFFLHLLGLDTAGHSHKPGSEKYIENMKVVDAGVERTVNIIEKFYRDNSTTYIFTSDHGMTDWGSHGAGSLHETETPFIAWGAGIKKDARPVDITQADIAPLISTLVGIPIPVNSIGVLPLPVLDMTEEDKSQALFLNAKQIYAQFEEKRQRTKTNLFWFFYRPYPGLNTQEYKNIISVIQTSLQEKDYEYVIKSCRSLIQASINGLDYYQNYYQRFLLTCIALTYLGWIAILLIYLTAPSHENIFLRRAKISGFFDTYIKRTEFYIIIQLIFFIVVAVTWFLLYVQSLPLTFYLYCTLPLYMWWHIFEKSEEFIPRFGNIFVTGKNAVIVFVGIILYLIGIESLVISFFYRESLSLILLIMGFWPYFLDKISYPIKISWTISCLGLSVFPFLPVVGSNFILYLIAISAVLWVFMNFAFLIINYFSNTPKYVFLDKNQMYLACIQSMFVAIALFNCYSVDGNIREKHGLTWYNQFISWVLSVVAIITGICGPNMVVGRLVNITSGLAIPFILLSVCYEPFFLLIYFMNLMIWLYIEHKEYSPIYRNLTTIPFNWISYRRNINGKRNQIRTTDFRRGFFIVVYAVLAFFGMGNMASINSFDPMWVRNFVVVFSPFLMTSLILFKSIIPYLVLSCVFRAVTNCIEAPIKKMFFIVLVFCDIMGLHFLFMVKNTGSWLDIGSSISHYIIVQTMVLFLLLLYVVAIPLTDSDILAHKINVPLYPYKVHKR